MRDVEHVHRPAPALGDAVDAAVQFGHHSIRVDAAHDRVAVLAVVREEVVGGPQRRHKADNGRFLTQVEVTVAADERLGVSTGSSFLESTDQHHVPVELADLLFPVAGRLAR